MILRFPSAHPIDLDHSPNGGMVATAVLVFIAIFTNVIVWIA